MAEGTGGADVWRKGRSWVGRNTGGGEQQDELLLGERSCACLLFL